MKDSIEKVLHHLVASEQKEEAELASKLLEAGVISDEVIKKTKSVNDFYYLLQKPYEQFLNGFVQIVFSGNDQASWLFTHYCFVESNFAGLVSAVEGTSCSSDKSQTIVNSLAKFLLKEDRIVWNFDQEYTYHLPKTVFQTHESVVDFYKALQRLYYGNPDMYIRYMADKKYLSTQ